MEVRVAAGCSGGSYPLPVVQAHHHHHHHQFHFHFHYYSSVMAAAAATPTTSSSLCKCNPHKLNSCLRLRSRPSSRNSLVPTFASSSSSAQDQQEPLPSASASASVIEPPTAEDLECVNQIKRVVELLKFNRDMLFSEVKLTIMIEDLREIERRKNDPDYITREELVAALEDVNEGRIPENRVALQKLAEEMVQWPNLEVQIKKGKPSKSMYARATDTGIDPAKVAKKLETDWDQAAEIDSEKEDNENKVPPLVGYGVLYLVSGIPIIIGVSVVLILFYNSLQ